MASAVEGCREHPRQGKRADWPDGANRLGSAGDKRALATMDCFEAPRMGLNLIFIKVSAAPTGALGPWKVEEP